jgi:flavin-dependent dehydrogenase
VSFVEEGLVNVCLLLEQNFLAGLPSTRWEGLREALSKANPALAERLAALEPAEEAVHAVGQVPFIPKETSAGPVLFVGDAAGMIAPLCGDGQAMALEGSLLLAGLLAEDDGGNLAERWDREWRKAFARRLRQGRWLQGLLLKSWGAEAAIRAVKWAPPLGRALLGSTRSS